MRLRLESLNGEGSAVHVGYMSRVILDEGAGVALLELTRPERFNAISLQFGLELATSLHAVRRSS